MAVCALAAASIVGIGLAEGLLRVFWTPPPADRAIHSFDFEKALQRDAELGYVPRANATVEYPPYHAAFTTNAAGLRGPGVPIEREPGRRRIMVLGDSFAWGHGVSAGEAFPELIDAALPDADVVNLGVPGYDLAKSLGFYRRVGQRYRPDIVVLAICQNDFRMDDRPELSGMFADKATQVRSIATTPANAPVSRSIKQWLHDHSYLYLLVQQTINTNKSLARVAVSLGIKEELVGFDMLDDNLRPALIDGSPQVRRSYDCVRGQLLAIRDQVQADGAGFVVALIPCVQAIDANELAKSIAYTTYEPSDFDLSRPMHMLMQFCHDHEIAAIDPTRHFKAAFDAGETLYLPGDLHFNAAGHQLFAKSVLTAIEIPLSTSGPVRPLSSRNRGSRQPPTR